MKHGILLLNKPTGISSSRILGPLKRIYPGRRVGHTGTLDPFAEGLLVVLVGTATRMSRWFLGLDKQYATVLAFGSETDTLDIEGSVVARAEQPTRAGLEQACYAFRGEISQVPPAYSALKVQGRRAYERARRGEELALPARRVTIYHISLTDEAATAPGARMPSARLSVSCSSGTYIRSLARDLALAASSRGHCHSLRRCAVGPFRVEDAWSLETLQEHPRPETALLPVVPAIERMQVMPVTTIDESSIRHIRTGRPLAAMASLPTPETPWLLCRDQRGGPVAVLAAGEGGWTYETVFPEDAA